MIPDHVVLEHVIRIAPFGLALWDGAAGGLVTDGMEVRVCPLVNGRALSPAMAHANRRGVFVAEGIEGLSGFEAVVGVPDDWLGVNSPPHRCLVEVRDTLDRFTPFVMHVDLQARGLTVPGCLTAPQPAAPSSPPQPSAYVTLLSTAARAVPAGVAAVRATLKTASGHAAAFAVLEVHESGRLIGRGVADERGEVAALFPYPELLPQPVASPPGTPRRLREQEWPLGITVRHRPDLSPHASDSRELERNGSPVADICELLEQPLGRLMTQTSPPLPLTDATLRYGEELVLGADDGATLFISSPA